MRYNSLLSRGRLGLLDCTLSHGCLSCYGEVCNLIDCSSWSKILSGYFLSGAWKFPANRNIVLCLPKNT